MTYAKSLSLAFICAFLAFGASCTQSTVSIATNPQGSFFFAIGTAISGMMTKQTGVQYRVAPYGGSSTYLPMLNRGELEFGLSNSGESVFAYQGIEMFEGFENPNLRGVATLIPAISGWVVAADDEYETVADLAGARVTYGFTSGRTFHYLATASLNASGLGWDDVRRVPVPDFVSGLDMLIAGRVDAAYTTFDVAAAQRAMASLPGGLRFISIDAGGDVHVRLQSVMPAAVPVQIRPSEANDGIVADPTNLVRMQFVLLASTETDADTVYELTRQIFENKAALASTLDAFNQFDPEAMADDMPIPFHQGALRFYRENGLAD